MKAILECQRLTKRYGNFFALSDLSFTLERGQIIGLLGPNGSGKTTLIKLINGLLVPSDGQIAVNGCAPGVESKKIVSYLPDRDCLPSQIRVKDALTLYSDFYSDFSMERAAKMLDALEIDRHSRLSALSKGTKEKVQLVLVMSRKAQLYLLDEPIAGVDPAAREFILKTIISNYNSNATVLISTHLISDIEQILDSFVFINQGKIFARGSVDSVREEKGMSLDEFFREVFRCLPNC